MSADNRPGAAEFSLEDDPDINDLSGSIVPRLYAERFRAELALGDIFRHELFRIGRVIHVAVRKLPTFAKLFRVTLGKIDQLQGAHSELRTFHDGDVRHCALGFIVQLLSRCGGCGHISQAAVRLPDLTQASLELQAAGDRARPKAEKLPDHSG